VAKLYLGKTAKHLVIKAKNTERLEILEFLRVEACKDLEILRKKCTKNVGKFDPAFVISYLVRGIGGTCCCHHHSDNHKT